MARHQFTDRELQSMMDMVVPVIHKSRAVLCLDCDNIFEVGGAQRCPSCGSGVGVVLAKLLDREGGT